jgi:hypothetical protein
MPSKKTRVKADGKHNSAEQAWGSKVTRKILENYPESLFCLRFFFFFLPNDFLPNPSFRFSVPIH